MQRGPRLNVDVLAGLLFIALGWWVNRRTQAWRITSR